ncbi:hypothetical protein A9Q81_09095 [Gammaproteobacteria bacterium 42_54_T18]|nr:hypothetical protein A9Q81_09095 [Gammaproteobacteria bacterium 42_54_T18]
MTQTINQIRQCSIFHEIQEASAQRLAEASTEKKYRKDGCVFDIGDPTEELYLLLGGRVCFDVYTKAGKKVTLGIAEPPWAIGEMELFDPSPRTSRATVLEEVTVLEIPKQAFFDTCHENPVVYEKLLKIYAVRLRESGIYLLNREDDKLLCRYILHSAERFGSIIDGMPVIDLSQESLASMTGIPRQRINRILNQWKEWGWVELQYGNIFIKDNIAMMAFQNN